MAPVSFYALYHGCHGIRLDVLLAPSSHIPFLYALPPPSALQWWLAGTNHPYAPFVGNALKWQSYAYDDGTT